jgi:hypothetical protein
MTDQELIAELYDKNVTPPDDPLRACLYLQHIRDTYDYFHTELAGPVGQGDGLGAADYAFVETALQDPELLNSFCKVLDDFLCPAIQAHLLTNNYNQLPNFRTYYVNNFLNANYVANVTGFFNTYVVTRDLLIHLAQNFRRNILEACQRILLDRPEIARTFAPPGTRLQGLQKIKSTGSDFHKGGKQVLILTFWVHNLISVSHTQVPISWSYFNLIYKPSDIETDCLIVGDSAAVNAIHPPQFQAKSLFEILNDGITAARQANPNLSLELLPTYKILPINYTSNQAVGYPLNIRRAYGYIEFLQHYHFGIGYYFYPWGSSDYKIFPRDDKTAICQKFYRLIGQISAIAVVFSIIDLHAENLIVKDYLPYLIDLEVSLTVPIAEITDTLLYNGGTNKGGVNGWLKESEFAWVQGRQSNLLRIDDTKRQQDAQNRLMAVEPSALIDPSSLFLAKNNCKGFRDMIDVIQTVNTPPHNNDLITWIARVNNILVRNLPMKTEDFRNLFVGATNFVFCSDNTALGRFVDEERGKLFADWQANNNRDPEFLALQNNYVIGDYNNGDIPVFYHRIGAASLDIMDSNGNEVQSPGNITFRASPTAPLQNQPYNLPNGRTTFFAASPFTANVVTTQLADVTNPATKGPMVNNFVGQILNALGLQNSVSVNNILS